MSQPSPPQTAPEAKPSQSWLRRVMTRGLAALLPTLATFALLAIIFNFFYDYAAKPIIGVIRWILNNNTGGSEFIKNYPHFSEFLLALCGILLALILFAALGLLVHGLFGKKIFAAFEDGLLQLPVVRAIYPYAKQVVEFFFDKKKPAFHSVVAIPYPHPGIYSIAFVTSDGMKSLNEKTSGSKISVFIPSSPMPVTGWIAFVPIENVIALPMSVEEALRFMVSAGLILPKPEEVDLGKKSFMKSRPVEAEKS